MDDQVRRLELERDLYRGLLALGADDPRPFFEEALRRVVAATESQQGYLAIYPGGDFNLEPAFWLAHDCSDDEVAQVQARLSSGIIGKALEEGKTISTDSALEDPRFANQESVLLYGLEAVLCAPVGQPRLGVLYLQGRSVPGSYPEADRQLLEEFARQVGPYAARLLSTPAAADPTEPYRRQLKGLENLAGRSAALAALFKQVALVAPLDVTVLLEGPSGVGKTAFARAIHINSPRALGPCVELNCAAIPENLLESELFGAERGAHSTADRRVEGKVAAAAGGTLFLDEVGELPLQSQGKLLQLLQDRTYFRLGGNRPLTADVRIIAATNTDLKQAVADKRFREDLYYRLAVLPMRVSSLSQRREDVGPVARALLARCVERHSLANLSLSPGALAALEAGDWPGNIRQLANTVEAGLIRAAGSGADMVEAGHLFLDEDAAEEEASLQGATRAFQRRLIFEALAANGWNVSQTARELEISRSRLNELIRSFKLMRPGD